MSELKCPFCNGKLYGCIGHPYCRNEKCEMCDEMMPQELLDLLDRTRKALDVARNGLEYIFGYVGVPKYVVKHIRQVLDEIKNETALEQKDHFADVSKMIEQKDVK